MELSEIIEGVLKRHGPMENRDALRDDLVSLFGGLANGPALIDTVIRPRVAGMNPAMAAPYGEAAQRRFSDKIKAATELQPEDFGILDLVAVERAKHYAAALMAAQRPADCMAILFSAAPRQPTGIARGTMLQYPNSPQRLLVVGEDDTHLHTFIVDTGTYYGIYKAPANLASVHTASAPAMAYALFFEASNGERAMQYPVRGTAQECEQDRTMYDPVWHNKLHVHRLVDGGEVTP
jgi:hypothetical protein